LSNSNRFNAIKQAVFLDRDGTINIEKDYLYRVEDFEFTDGAIQGIRLLNDAGFLVIVVTNQSGVARGYYDEADVEHLHHHIDELLRSAGARVDAWYYCPHHTAGNLPYNQDCLCRKPLPGMLLKAASDHAIDLTRSWMVGDKTADIQAGLAAGCKPVLVLTGYGISDSHDLPLDVPCCADILAAARLIVAV